MTSTPTDNLRLKRFRDISRLLTIVENELDGADDILKNLMLNNVPVIGITGPPGAGKSTLLNKIICGLSDNSRVAVLAVDPTSPFSFGSILGDRIRMQTHATSSKVYIRSVATRGSLGGLATKIIEMTDVLKASEFDYIFIETVGVGQSEVEIAGLADLTFVVLVPEAGDEIQSIKAGLMEIGDAFIVNKADREGAEQYAMNIRSLLQNKGKTIFKTSVNNNEGIQEVINFIKNYKYNKEPSLLLLTQKAFNLIEKKRMADIDKKTLQLEVAEAFKQPGFNLYKFVDSKIMNS